MKAVFLFPVLLSVASFSFASAVPLDNLYQRNEGNRTSFSFTPDGGSRVTSAAPAGAPRVGAFGVSQSPSGVVFDTRGNILVPGTRGTVPIDMRLRLSAGVIARTLARAVAVYSVLEGARALWDIWAENGINPRATQPNFNDPNIISISVAAREWGRLYNGVSSSDSRSACTALARNMLSDNGLECRLPGVDMPGQLRNYQLYRYGVWFGAFSVMREGNFLPCSVGFLNTVTGRCEVRASDPLTPAQIEARLIAGPSVSSPLAPAAVAAAMTVPSVARYALDELTSQSPVITFPGGHQSMQVGSPVTTSSVSPSANGGSREVIESNQKVGTIVGNGINWRYDTTIRVVYRDSTGAIVSDITTAPSAPVGSPPAQSPSLPCGIPGTPPCAVSVDESGVPPPRANDDVAGLLSSVFAPITDCASDIVACLPAFPDVSFTIDLPTQCGVIRLEAFEPFLPGIDLCPWKSMFHQIMTVLWLGAGIFGAMALISRGSTS